VETEQNAVKSKTTTRCQLVVSLKLNNRMLKQPTGFCLSAPSSFKFDRASATRSIIKAACTMLLYVYQAAKMADIITHFETMPINIVYST